MFLMGTVVSARKAEKKFRGIDAAYRGSEYEKKVAKVLVHKYNVEITDFNWKVRNMEFDIVAKEKRFRGREILVECKDREKSQVTIKDFVRFREKFEKIAQYNKGIKGIFAYRGKKEHGFDTVVTDVWNAGIPISVLVVR